MLTLMNSAELRRRLKVLYYQALKLKPEDVAEYEDENDFIEKTMGKLNG